MKMDFDPRYPDDDGRMKRAWIKDSVERGESACERVYKVFEDRNWLVGQIWVTEANSRDDECGYDIFVPMNRELTRILGIKQGKYGVPVQVKSSNHAVGEFLREHKIFRQGKFVFESGEYIFTFNGQNPRDLIVADLVGQMVVLAGGRMREDIFLSVLAGRMRDKEAVQRWRENREIIKDDWWYKDWLR